MSVSKNKIFEAIHNENKIRELQNKIEELMYMPGGIGYIYLLKNILKIFAIIYKYLAYHKVHIIMLTIRFA